MFLPEELLYKSGQLARVWLAANQQKKLTKTQVLQDKITEDIEVIIRPDALAGGPLALRLNGQLLLGVVRIYSRKARYLLDDCNDALWKIKMAFRPGNIDLPAHQTHVANPASLTLPDVLTELDLLAPMPDPELLLAGPADLGATMGFQDTTLPDWDNSQFLSGSIEQPRAQEPVILDDGDDLQLDLGEDLDMPPPIDEGTSIEQGRNAPLERRASEDHASPKEIFDDDMVLDLGEDLTEGPAAPELNIGDDIDVSMGGMEEPQPPVEPTLGDEPVPEPRERSASPLSELGADEERELEQTHQEFVEREGNTSLFQQDEQQEDDVESVHHARAKRRKVLEQDASTQISTSEIKQQQQNRDKILKPASFLPRDPLLLALINMQKSGGFVSSILGDGRSQGWAPELRGILSLEVVSRPGQKRKRDSGVADLETEEDEAEDQQGKMPQLEFEQDEPELEAGVGIGGDTTLAQDEEQIQLPDEPGIAPLEEEEEAFSPLPDDFDNTTAPLLHPAESGPVSLGTKHAVHLLRERFGPEAETDESQRQKANVLFQDMLPEERTTRAEATKMFFEVLVLATKDAIKVEQPSQELGGPLRIRGKRGLWGSWAETSAGGEMASQSAPVATPAEVVAEA